MMAPTKFQNFNSSISADNSPRDLSRLPPNHTPSPVDIRVIVAVLVVLLVTTIAILSIICYCRRRKNKRTYRVRNDDYIPVLVSEEPGKGEIIVIGIQFQYKNVL